MKIYIAGKISGNDTYHEDFKNAAEIAKIWEIDITNNNDTEFGGF